MASPKEIRTFKDIQDAVLLRNKLQDNTTNRDGIKERINTTYQKIATDEYYRWSGVTVPLKLRNRHTAGTITTVKDSDEIVGVSTLWVENDHRNLRMKIGSHQNSFKIIRVSSSTAITLDSQFTGDSASGLSYEIYKDEYGLPPDLQDVRTFRVPTLSLDKQPVPSGPTELDNIRSRSPFTTGTPKKYTLWGHNVYTEKTWATFNINTDWWEDEIDIDVPRNKNLIVWPGVMTEDRIASLRYTFIPYPLLLDADEPVIPYGRRMVLVWGTLLDHFLSNRDIVTEREWARRFEEEKGKMAADIETTDDQLILKVDRRRWSSRRRLTSIFREDIQAAD